MPALVLQPDPRSPVPLYHQIAEALRYRIATGAVPIGAVLPPLRLAAERWGVNLHTVRRAYAELALAGVVETRAPQGTVVLPAAGERVPPEGGIAGRRGLRTREAFLERVIGEARERHGLTPEALVALLEQRRGRTHAAPEIPVHVVECSASQAADLARQLEERWRVHAVPWPIDRPAPPAPHAVVATYFHYNDLRVRWPDRFRDMQFVAIRPDPVLASRLLEARGPGARAARRVPVVLCERDESMLRNIAADVSSCLPTDRFRVTLRVVRRADALLRGVGRHDCLLVAPRVWGELPEVTRNDPRVHELRYVFDPKGLEAVGRENGWAPREENP